LFSCVCGDETRVRDSRRAAHDSARISVEDSATPRATSRAWCIPCAASRYHDDDEWRYRDVRDDASSWIAYQTPSSTTIRVIGYEICIPPHSTWSKTLRSAPVSAELFEFVIY